ncbi:IclR family transcriptional regulator [Serinicoccus kebangsaanensis]|uniref:IclR family transcriptional regulator n=1 Tax=Serinicoccus kebangsaanensis TaxID=2602069 RepID=UPI00124C8D1E|nr:IclR family transcriptional regulator [Serinicoccus kebangsaanensis]
MGQREDRPRGVQSVDRALDIVELLAAAPAPIGVTEIARELGLAQGTAHRLVSGLVARGWVRQDTDRRYAVGPAAMRVGDASYRTLGASAAPALREAVAATGETANLALLEGRVMVYVAQAPSPHTLRIFAEVGRRVPLHSTAVGKVALATRPRAAWAELLGDAPLEPRTPHTVTDVARLVEELEQVRRQGFALDDEEQELGVRCVAVPVQVAGLEVAMSVSGPTERMTRERAQQVVPELRRIAAALAGGTS